MSATASKTSEYDPIYRPIFAQAISPSDIVVARNNRLTETIDKKSSFGKFLHDSEKDITAAFQGRKFCPTPPTESINEKTLFRKLANEWKRETAHQSSIVQRTRHPAYRRILSMGQSVIPLILEDLKKDPDHWFFALAYLTDENPIPFDFSGTVEDAAEAWIEWGRKKYAA